MLLLVAGAQASSILRLSTSAVRGPRPRASRRNVSSRFHPVPDATESERARPSPRGPSSILSTLLQCKAYQKESVHIELALPALRGPVTPRCRAAHTRLGNDTLSDLYLGNMGRAQTFRVYQ